MAGWIGARLASRGLSATPDAVALLAQRVEGNLLAAAQEIDKLVVLHGKGRIDAAEMETLVADSARFDAFKLTDAAFAGDGARALRILAGLRAEGDELIALMGWLVNQLQLALRLANARDFAAQAAPSACGRRGSSCFVRRCGALRANTGWPAWRARRASTVSPRAASGAMPGWRQNG